MNNYKPNPIIIEHAAQLWVDMLSNPKYDNGDFSIANVMVKMIPRNNTQEILKKFKDELINILMNPFEHEYNSGGKINKYSEFIQRLGVDYNPDIYLATAAEKSGLDLEFPWKTNMNLYDNYLSLGYGYGQDWIYHYPISNNRWLVTSLNGTDIKKIINLIESDTITIDLCKTNAKD